VIPIRGLSKKFHVAAEKSPFSRRGIVSKLRTIERSNQRGTVMTITEYLAATALVALILWAVLRLLMQES
jgi:Flp pilus assembly protein TadB